MQLPITLDEERFRLRFGEGVFGPEQEVRTLDSIRHSLLDPNAAGPDELYVIAMDVGMHEHRKLLEEQRYLFGIVAYAPGRVGGEPVRSQGHVHKPTPRHGVSPPELFEIRRGTAIVYMQESVGDDPGRCFAIHASAGDTVLCPPGWGHMVINGDPSNFMVFLALCDRDYAGFDYGGVRRHGGLAHFPVLTPGGDLVWQHNDAYTDRQVVEKRPEHHWYAQTVADHGLYGAAIRSPEQFRQIPRPDECPGFWESFVP